MEVSHRTQNTNLPSNGHENAAFCVLLPAVGARSKQQWSKDTALGDPLVAREERRRLVVDHYPLLPIVKKISEPVKSCAANATGLQSQEQVLMQNIVECP